MFVSIDFMRRKDLMLLIRCVGPFHYGLDYVERHFQLFEVLSQLNLEIVFQEFML